ncbi:hypothetical protein BDR03DRAFT_313448 [Suillus americanus]|nr:hypothetical protein BDR03DRAFT_313448 [Suillus americanus]
MRSASTMCLIGPCLWQILMGSHELLGRAREGTRTPPNYQPCKTLRLRACKTEPILMAMICRRKILDHSGILRTGTFRMNHALSFPSPNVLEYSSSRL